MVFKIENINMSKGAVNVAFAIITFIKFNENRIISSMTIEIINIEFQLTLKQCYYKRKYTSEFIFYRVRFPFY